jgi:hypothetical protein
MLGIIGYEFLIFTIVMFVVGIAIIYRFEIDHVDRFRLIISLLGAISVLLVTYNLYATFKFNEAIEKNRIAYNTIDNIRNKFLNPQHELVELYPEGYFLYASMYLDNPVGNEPTEYNPSKRAEVERYMSIRLFQAVEDFLSTAAFDLTGVYVWINNFLSWLQSPILQKNWATLAFNFADDTRLLVDRLIEKSNELIELRKKKGSLSSQDYDVISKNFTVVYR